MFSFGDFSCQDLLLLVLASLCLAIWYFGTKTYGYWSDRGVANRKPTVPFFGNIGLTDLLKSNSELITGIYESFSGKDCGGFYFFTTPVLIVRDPALVTKILVTDFTSFTSRGFHTNESLDPLSKNLIHTNGKSWKYVRPRLTAPFSLTKLKGMVPEMDGFALKTVQQLQKHADDSSAPVDAVAISDRYMIDVVASCAFGLQAGTIADPRSEFYRVCMRVFDGYHFFLHAFVGFLFPRLHALARMTVARRLVTRFFTAVARENLQLRDGGGGGERKDFFQALISIKEQQREAAENGGKGDVFDCDDEFIAANTFMFFTAGFDSSGKVGSFILYELAVNDHIQSRAREEVTRVLDAHNGKLTIEAVQEMVYLEQIVAEANRKYPILSVIFRKCDKRYELPGGGHVEPGVPIMIPSSAMHHDPELYPNPGIFDPERFNEENKAKRHPGTYLPFGMGPRVCPAWQFAFIEIKVMIARIIAEYYITLHPSTEHPLKLHPRMFLLNPEKGISINILKVA